MFWSWMSRQRRGDRHRDGGSKDRGESTPSIPEIVHLLGLEFSILLQVQVLDDDS
jgi:hypothetical protein